MPDVISKEDAKAAGLKLYFTGVPCKRGHLSERCVANNVCVECGKVWREENKDHLTELYREYKSKPENKKKHAERVKQKYREDNPNWRRPNMMTDEEKRLDRNAKRRAYYVRRRDYLLALNTAQRVKRQKAEGRYTEHDVRRILKDQKGKCGFCAKKLRNDYHVDHITPLAKGGTNWPHNIQVLCQPCNNRKAAKDPIVFAQENGKLL